MSPPLSCKFAFYLDLASTLGANWRRWGHIPCCILSKLPRWHVYVDGVSGGRLGSSRFRCLGIGSSGFGAWGSMLRPGARGTNVGNSDFLAETCQNSRLSGRIRVGNPDSSADTRRKSRQPTEGHQISDFLTARQPCPETPRQPNSDAPGPVHTTSATDAPPRRLLG
jgi:hypothetical protein